MTQCRGCGAEIKFVKSLKGKWMPVDPEPATEKDADQGDTLVREDGKVITVGRDSDEGLKCYVPHWITCPNADEFKRRR